MSPIRSTKTSFVAFTLSILLALMCFAGGAECADTDQESSEELLLQIIDLHSELVTNETFLAQARLLSVYLEVVQPLDEAKKIEVYRKVLNILAKIKNSGSNTKQKSPVKEMPESDAEQDSLEEQEKKAQTVYEPGAALLEIFKSDSIEKLPDLPVIRTYWKRDLAFSGYFLLLERASEIGRNSPYVARFSFYYQAKQSGKYSFIVNHFSDGINSEGNACSLRIGGTEIIKANRDQVVQGICSLEKGFHRVEFWLVSKVPYWQDVPGKQMGNFQVKILTPDAFDAVPLTTDMMLLKKE